MLKNWQNLDAELAGNRWANSMRIINNYNALFGWQIHNCSEMCVDQTEMWVGSTYRFLRQILFIL